MANKVKKKNNPNSKTEAKSTSDPPTLLFPLLPILPEVTEGINFSFLGFAQVIAPYTGINPDEMRDSATTEARVIRQRLYEDSVNQPLTTVKSNVETELDNWNRTINSMILAQIAAEAASLGQIDVSVNAYWNNPIIAAARDLALKFTVAPQMETLYPVYRRALLKEWSPFIPNEEWLTRMYIKGIINQDTYADLMKQNGYGYPYDQNFAAAMLNYPDVNTLITMKRRGIIPINDFNTYMQRNMFGNAQINQLARLSDEIPEPYRLADFAAKGLIDANQLFTGFAWHGMDNTMAIAWRDSQQYIPELNILLELYWRGRLTWEQLYSFLRLKGARTEICSAVQDLTEQIPPSSDLVTMVVREAFDPAYVTPAPSIFATYMAKKGFTQVWSDRYWTMHWIRIPLAQAYDNYYRGYWTKEDLLEELRVADFHPDIRDDIANVAYGVPSIRELGYGYDVGVWGISDIIRFRRWGGLSPEDAEKAGEAMVAYRTEAEREAVRREYMHLFALGKIDESTFSTHLQRLGTASPAQALWLERGRLEGERIKKEPAMTEPRIINSSEAITAFKMGLRDETWLANALRALEWTEDRVILAVERAKAEKAEAEEPPPEPMPAMLTASQMRQMYLLGLMTRDEMQLRFAQMRYFVKDAKLLTDIYTYVEEKPVEYKPLTTSTATGLYEFHMWNEYELWSYYVNQNYTEDDAALLVIYTRIAEEYPIAKKLYAEGVQDVHDIRNTFQSLGMEPDQADELAFKIYREVSVQRITQEKDLTKSEIIKGVKNQVLTFGQGVELLMDIGYDMDEADYILKINKVVAAGDPESYLEMKSITEAYKKARGEKAIAIPEAAYKIEMEMKAVKAELDKERKLGVNEEKIAELALKFNELEARLRTVLTKVAIK